MRKFTIRLLIAALVLVSQFTAAGHAVEPDEILADPKLEQRARALSANLRCLVCQNQSIDDSNAEMARDLRVLVRERLQAGDTDQQIIDFAVEKYGQFILLKPQLNQSTLLLWLSPLFILLIAICGLVLMWRRYKAAGVQIVADTSDGQF